MEPTWQSEDGRVRLWNADCRSVFAYLSGVDAVVTDPPYGIAHKSNGQLFREAKPIGGDESLEVANSVCDWAIENELPLVAFFSPYSPLAVQWRSILVWRKGEHVGIGGDRETCWKRDFELIGVRKNGPLNGKRDSAVVDFPAVLPPPSGHFCEKPLPLMEYLLWKVPGDVVCDPCMGSGATGEAAVRLGKGFVGIESEPEWFDYAQRRIQEALGMEVREPSGLRQRRMFT